MNKKPFHFYIDVVGTCNLRCPSCPVGNMPEASNALGSMSPDMLRRILDKAAHECTVTNIGLFNWTEPLIHPYIDEMVRIAQEYSPTCSVSSNLNINKPGRYWKLLEAAPTVLRISLSGISQETYGTTHKGGSIDNVLRNLEVLVQIKEKIKSPTRIAVAFHRYLSNFHEESALKAYCDELGVIFQPTNALMLPLEKVLAFCGNDFSGTTINDNDKNLINNLALPLSAALHEAAQVSIQQCKLAEEQVVLNYRGDAMLCCASYDEKIFSVGNYLELNLNELQLLRRKQNVCKSCIKNGISNYFQYIIPNMEQIVSQNLRGQSLVGEEMDSSLGNY